MPPLVLSTYLSMYMDACTSYLVRRDIDSPPKTKGEAVRQKGGNKNKNKAEAKKSKEVEAKPSQLVRISALLACVHVLPDVPLSPCLPFARYFLESPRIAAYF
jgi:hypothetical protein